ncbi:hypothetical protein VDGD_21392 [Verticillium dahliae]|nr:Pyridoxine biosynthesis protein PDX1 [Verticillium dahliae VDG1]RBQ74272.1 hypothetical protein VDGD_21392 [Verticillium dahliae]
MSPYHGTARMKLRAETDYGFKAAAGLKVAIAPCSASQQSTALQSYGQSPPETSRGKTYGKVGETAAGAGS